MRSSKKKPAFRGLAAAAAAALILVGCNDSTSPTEPGPNPTPGNIAGAWTGTYHGVSYACDTSAQGSFEQTGSAILGTVTATGSCGDVIHFSGALQGNTLEAYITDYEVLEGGAHGILSGSSLEITIDNGSGLTVAQMHLHR